MDSDILNQLPHGPEFRFVDVLDSLQPGKSAVAQYLVPDAEQLPLLRGHFPGDPLLPGVVLIEMIAQLGGLVVQSVPDQAPLRALRLTAIRQAKILGAARPGQQLEIRAELVQRSGPLAMVKGEIRCGAERLAEAQVILSGQEGAAS